MEKSFLQKNVYGNSELTEMFDKEIKNGRLSHAYIIEGVSGSGKYTLVLSLLAELATGEREQGLITEGMCADIVTLELEDDKKTIGVDAVRAIRESAFIKPNDLDFKAYIIKQADLMTPQAQNALLKLLEEPPGNVYFFLLCENSSLLLPTVRSRAPVMRMQLFTNRELEGYILADRSRASGYERLTEQEREHILCVSGGSIGRVLEQLEGRSKAEKDFCAEALELLELLFTKQRGAVFVAVNDLPSKRAELLEFLQCFRLALRDLTALKQKGNSEMLFGYREKITPYAKKFTLKQLIGAYSSASSAENNLRQNMNVASVKTAFACELWKCVCP